MKRSVVAMIFVVALTAHEIHTVKLGTEIQAIKNLLNLHFQYGFSFGGSAVHSSGNRPESGDPDWCGPPTIRPL
jgi:hypothetical protein